MGNEAKNINNVLRETEEHVEIIEGVEVMQASPSPKHARMQAKLTAKISTQFDKIAVSTTAESTTADGGDGGWWILTVAGVKYDANNIFQHDIAGWKRDNLEDLPESGLITKVPDWVCEILSSNKTRDLIIKERVLFYRGVQYYWLVDLRDKLINVCIYSKNGYIAHIYSLEDATVHLPPFEACGLPLAELFS